jgi:hypothetical protein
MDNGYGLLYPYWMDDDAASILKFCDILAFSNNYYLIIILPWCISVAELIIIRIGGLSQFWVDVIYFRNI